MDNHVRHIYFREIDLIIKIHKYFSIVKKYIKKTKKIPYFYYSYFHIIIQELFELNLR